MIATVCEYARAIWDAMPGNGDGVAMLGVLLVTVHAVLVTAWRLLRLLRDWVLRQ